MIVRSKEDALVRLTECTLATVLDLAGKKSANKNEFIRQCNIAQEGIYWCRDVDSVKDSLLVKEVVKNHSSVKEWLLSEAPEAKHLEFIK